MDLLLLGQPATRMLLVAAIGLSWVAFSALVMRWALRVDQRRAAARRAVDYTESKWWP